MSDNLPVEIQEDIISRLPVKSLIQFRSVSKAWKSLIDSSHFVKHYSAQNTQQHLLVRYNHGYNIRKPTYVSIVDDDTFPSHSVSITHPPLVDMLQSPAIIDRSHGLLCLYSCDCLLGDVRKDIAVLWNVSIRKAVAVVVPNVADAKERMYSTVLGFGVCRETTDPKIFKIKYINSVKDMESVTCIPWQVEVFTLSTGAWRSAYGILPRIPIQFGYGQTVNGFYYWLATDTSTIDGELESYNLIVSFDMTSEEFREINLPDNLVYNRSICNMSISNIRESLVVVKCDANEGVYVVWIMGGSVPESFTKLFTIDVPGATILRVLEFRESGEPLIEIAEDHSDPFDDSSSLVVYEPNSKHVSNLDFSGTSSFYVNAYRETLLLLDQPDLGKRYSCLISQILLFMTKVNAALQRREVFEAYTQTHGMNQ